MSKSIANLEKEMGFPLFKRSVSGVKPTAEAGELYSYFRTVMKSYTGLQKKVNDIGMRKNGVLKRTVLHWHLRIHFVILIFRNWFINQSSSKNRIFMS